MRNSKLFYATGRNQNDSSSQRTAAKSMSKHHIGAPLVFVDTAGTRVGGETPTPQAPPSVTGIPPAEVGVDGLAAGVTVGDRLLLLLLLLLLLSMTGILEAVVLGVIGAMGAAVVVPLLLLLLLLPLPGTGWLPPELISSRQSKLQGVIAAVVIAVAVAASKVDGWICDRDLILVSRRPSRSAPRIPTRAQKKYRIPVARNSWTAMRPERQSTLVNGFYSRLLM